jgi:hypothetical protein
MKTTSFALAAYAAASLVACGGAIAPETGTKGENNGTIPGGDQSSGSPGNTPGSDTPSHPREDAGTPTDNGGSSVPPTCHDALASTQAAPPVSHGDCSLVGTWDVQTAPDGTNLPTQASFTFADNGRFVGGKYGKDTCETLFMWGDYQLTPELFEIVTGHGMGVHCNPTWTAGYTIEFDASCKSAGIHNAYDNCTGTRQYLMIDSIMTKR